MQVSGAPCPEVAHGIATGVVVDELGQGAEHGVLELLAAVPLEARRRRALQPLFHDGAMLRRVSIVTGWLVC